MASPTAPERNPRGQGDLLRDRLVDAALALLDEGTDPTKLSIRAVTKRAGVSPTAFYLQFENHDALLEAMIDRCFTEFRDAVRQGTAGATDPAGRLTRAGVAYWTSRAGSPPATRSTSCSSGPPRVRRRPKPAAADDSFNDLVALVLDYLGDDDPRRDDADFLARGIWSGLHGYVTLSQTRTGIGWPREDEFVARLAQAWLGAPRSSAPH